MDGSVTQLSQHEQDPKWSPVGEWLSIMRLVHTIEYCSALKRRKILAHLQQRWTLRASCLGTVLFGSIYLQLSGPQRQSIQWLLGRCGPATQS